MEVGLSSSPTRYSPVPDPACPRVPGPRDGWHCAGAPRIHLTAPTVPVMPSAQPGMAQAELASWSAVRPGPNPRPAGAGEARGWAGELAWHCPLWGEKWLESPELSEQHLPGPVSPSPPPQPLARDSETCPQSWTHGSLASPLPGAPALPTADSLSQALSQPRPSRSPPARRVQPAEPGSCLTAGARTHAAQGPVPPIRPPRVILQPPQEFPAR